MKIDIIKELKLVCIAIFILCICEVCASFLRLFFSPLATLAVIRSTENLFLLLLLVLTPGGLDFAGLSKEMGYSGFKAGLIWSFVFGMAVLVTGKILYATGTNPLSLIRVNFPQGNLVLFFLTAGVIGPIAEEIFFRGILYSALRRQGMLIALFVTTLIFALFHTFFHGGHGGLPIFQIVGGLIFALSFESSKSLVAPIIIHILGNLSIFLLVG